MVGDPITKKYKKISKEKNFKQTKDCIDFLIRNKVNRILFVSTCSNYGLSGKKSLKESSKLSPLSYYAKDKVKIEKYIMKIKPKTSLCIFRFATAFGFSKRMRFDLTINDFCYQLINKNKLDVYDPLIMETLLSCKRFCEMVFIFSQ